MEADEARLAGLPDRLVASRGDRSVRPLVEGNGRFDFVPCCFDLLELWVGGIGGMLRAEIEEAAFRRGG